MATPYSGTSTLHTSIQLVSDGDKRSAANINAAPQALQDSVIYLRDHKVQNDGAASIAGPLTIGPGTTIFNGAVTLNTKVTLGTGGRVSERSTEITNTNTTVDASTQHVIFHITNDTDYTLSLDDTGSPEVGDEITIQVFRTTTKAGKLNVRLTSLGIWVAQFDMAANPFSVTNQGTLVVKWCGASNLEWRVVSIYNFTPLDPSGP